ncbi:MAG: bifunctional adenosylcobinamide kinase/adenosylcobinamide-phosphate guanylyltransferase [Lachnospiraceae bacterium]|nr:bifunctional adenosylcobinamide kinase/adenosylcobinamide-phosphate guanylyltransferase [Lachnospiraceae bacterium]
MITLIIGGADSGKSEYAERLLIGEAGDHDRIYLATMETTPEASCRIEHHVNRRAGAGFVTVECSRNPESLRRKHDAFVLFEDLPNFVANVMFDEGGFAGEEVLFSRLDELMEHCENVYFVTGDIASAGADYGELTLEYMKVLGHVQQHVAARAHRVIEVVAGVPNILRMEV